MTKPRGVEARRRQQRARTIAKEKAESSFARDDFRCRNCGHDIAPGEIHVFTAIRGNEGYGKCQVEGPR